MIPQAAITAWGAQAPWPTEVQIEQDLLLSRAMIEIAQDPLLGRELVMRGGTCLHKLLLAKPLRYSEDLDYVRRTHSGIGPYADAIRRVFDSIGMSGGSTIRNDQMFHIQFDAPATAAASTIRIKIETNVRETAACYRRTGRPHAVTSGWWSGSADIPTYAKDELAATKFRALYERRKGRDLFDLWLFVRPLRCDPGRVISALEFYMKQTVFTFPELRLNLLEKLASEQFRSDLDQLRTGAMPEYAPELAADLIMERLGSRLRNAPSVDAIRAGGWRD